MPLACPVRSAHCSRFSQQLANGGRCIDVAVHRLARLSAGRSPLPGAAAAGRQGEVRVTLRQPAGRKQGVAQWPRAAAAAASPRLPLADPALHPHPPLQSCHVRPGMPPLAAVVLRPRAAGGFSCLAGVKHRGWRTAADAPPRVGGMAAGCGWRPRAQVRCMPPKRPYAADWAGRERGKWVRKTSAGRPVHLSCQNRWYGSWHGLRESGRQCLAALLHIPMPRTTLLLPCAAWASQLS